MSLQCCKVHFLFDYFKEVPHNLTAALLWLYWKCPWPHAWHQRPCMVISYVTGWHSVLHLCINSTQCLWLLLFGNAAEAAIWGHNWGLLFCKTALGCRNVFTFFGKVLPSMRIVLIISWRLRYGSGMRVQFRVLFIQTFLRDDAL